jgi:beta-glucosidase-like glycosyl hydrolase
MRLVRENKQLRASLKRFTKERNAELSENHFQMGEKIEQKSSTALKNDEVLITTNAEKEKESKNNYVKPATEEPKIAKVIEVKFSKKRNSANGEERANNSKKRFTLLLDIDETLLTVVKVPCDFLFFFSLGSYLIVFQKVTFYVYRTLKMKYFSL